MFPGEERAFAGPHHKRQSVTDRGGTFLRWALMGAMFVFLLAMVITLTEVMAFQNRVVELLGSADRARSAVLMLHQIENGQSAPSRQEALPFAAVAVYLDRVRSAQEQLGRFLNPRQRTAPNEDKQDQIAQRYLQERRRLADNLADLHRILADEEPQIVVAEQLREIKAAVGELRRFGVAGSPEPASESARAAGPAADSRMLTLLTGIQSSLAGLDGSVAAQESLKQLDGLVAELEGRATDRPASDPSTPVPNETEQTGDNGTAGQSGQASTQDESLSAAAQMVNQVKELQDGLAGLEEAVQLDPLNAVLSQELQDFSATVNDLYELRLEDPAGLRPNGEDLTPARPQPTDYESALLRIGEAHEDLDRDLTARFGTEYTTAKNLAEQINTMSAQARVFEELTVGGYSLVDGDITTSEAAADLYDQTLATLKSGLDDMERSLGRNTDVIAVGHVIRAGTQAGEVAANAQAQAILHDFYALDRMGFILRPFSPFASDGTFLASFGIDPRQLATLDTVSITTIYIFMIGAIGSLIYIAKDFIGSALRGRSPERPFSWLLFRPLFGVVVAFALYLLVQAGQLAFGTNGDDGFGTDLNIPIISVVALFAGLLSWHALAAIESRGKAWFGEYARNPLWATGLNNALNAEDQSIGACAAQVGRSPEQVERWLRYADQVTVEMQDRLITWLGRQRAELFGERKPPVGNAGEVLWGTGLKVAMQSQKQRLDAKGLAELLDEDDPERVRRWMDLELQISPPMQWKLVELLGVAHHRLFERHIDHRPAWAVGLRLAMKQKRLSAQDLGERLRLGDVARIHAWKELDSVVPVDLQDDLVEALGTPDATLYVREDLGPSFFLWAHGLDKLLAEIGRSEAELADAVDVERDRVIAWISRTKSVPPETRKDVARFLGRKEEDIFKSYREHLAGGASEHAAGGGDAAGPGGGEKPPES